MSKASKFLHTYKSNISITWMKNPFMIIFLVKKFILTILTYSAQYRFKRLTNHQFKSIGDNSDYRYL